MACTPDGKTAYIVNLLGRGPSPAMPGRDRHQHAGQADLYRAISSAFLRRSRSLRTRRTAYIVSRAHMGHGHADRDRHQHAGQVDQDRRRFPPGDRDRDRGTEDRLRRQRLRKENDRHPGTTATNTPPDQHRRYRPSHRGNRDRDHAGREDRLHRRWESPYGHTDLDRHQYAGQADQDQFSPGRSRSRRTGRPPTSPPLPTSPGVAPGAQLVRSYQVATATNTPGKPIKSPPSLKRSRSHQRMVAGSRKLLPAP